LRRNNSGNHRSPSAAIRAAGERGPSFPMTAAPVTPCSDGGSPLKIDACDGRVQGAGAIARVKTLPRRPSWAKVVSEPALTSLARAVSRTTSTMFGRSGPPTAGGYHRWNRGPLRARGYHLTDE
jgi:hypothetical protein